MLLQRSRNVAATAFDDTSIYDINVDELKIVFVNSTALLTRHVEIDIFQLNSLLFF